MCALIFDDFFVYNKDVMIVFKIVSIQNIYVKYLQMKLSDNLDLVQHNPRLGGSIDKTRLTISSLLRPMMGIWEHITLFFLLLNMLENFHTLSFCFNTHIPTPDILTLTSNCG